MLVVEGLESLVAEGTDDEKEHLEKKRNIPERTRRGKGAFKSLLSGRFVHVFERSLFCSPRLHLFDKKILWNIIIIYNNFSIRNCFKM